MSWWPIGSQEVDHPSTSSGLCLSQLPQLHPTILLSMAAFKQSSTKPKTLRVKEKIVTDPSRNLVHPARHPLGPHSWPARWTIQTSTSSRVRFKLPDKYINMKLMAGALSQPFDLWPFGARCMAIHHQVASDLLCQTAKWSMDRCSFELLGSSWTSLG